MAATNLTFTGEQGGYGSNWFQPNNAFQLDLVFPESENPNKVQIFSANDNNGTEPLAKAAEFELKAGERHINVPIFDVIPDCGTYFKIVTRLMPSSASYMTE